MKGMGQSGIEGAQMLYSARDWEFWAFGVHEI